MTVAARSDEGPAQAPPHQSARSRRWSIALRSVFGLATLGLLFLMFKPGDILAALAQARPDCVAWGLALMALGVAARAYRWMLMLAHLGIALPFWRSVEITMISLWFNTFLPGNLGGDLYRIYDVARACSLTLRPAVTVVAERITGVLALLAVAVTALVFFREEMGVPAWMFAAAIGLTGAATAAVLALMLYFPELWGATLRIVPALRRVLSQERAERVAGVSAELRGNPRFFAQSFALGLVVQGLTLLSFYSLGLAIDPGVHALYFFTFVPLIEIASLLPLTINGIGLKEGLIVYSLTFSNTPEAVSMSMGLLFRIAATALALVGGLFLLCRRSSTWQVEARPGLDESL